MRTKHSEIFLIVFSTLCLKASHDVWGRCCHLEYDQLWFYACRRNSQTYIGTVHRNIKQLSSVVFRYGASEDWRAVQMLFIPAVCFFSLNGCFRVWGFVGRNSTNALTFDPLFHWINVDYWVADLLPVNKSGTLMPSSDEVLAQACWVQAMHTDTKRKSTKNSMFVCLYFFTLVD